MIYLYRVGEQKVLDLVAEVKAYAREFERTLPDFLVRMEQAVDISGKVGGPLVGKSLSLADVAERLSPPTAMRLTSAALHRAHEGRAKKRERVGKGE